MAYISTEEVKAKRNLLKLNFPNLKFSVSRDNYSSINVSILAGDIDFSADLNGATDKDVNHYHISKYPSAPILSQIFSIINSGNHDNSDSQSDYFDVGFYVNLSIGKWNKPYIQRKAA